MAKAAKWTIELVDERNNGIGLYSLIIRNFKGEEILFSYKSKSRRTRDSLSFKLLKDLDGSVLVSG